MQVISFSFLIFLPIVVFLYAILPQKIRYLWLLAASIFFYLSAGPVYGIFLLLSILLTYTAARGMEHRPGSKKMILVLCLILNLGVLGVLKYAEFFCSSAVGILSLFHVKVSDPSIQLLLPVGISFYMFQALGYVIDVYRGEIAAEKNILRYALFVSFFPNVLSGPI